MPLHCALERKDKTKILIVTKCALDMLQVAFLSKKISVLEANTDTSKPPTSEEENSKKITKHERIYSLPFQLEG